MINFIKNVIKCLFPGDKKNHNCLECKTNYTFKDEFLNDTNCYEICPYLYYFDYDKNYYCTNTSECPKEIFNKKISEKNKCVDSCEKDDKYKYEFKKKCYEICPFNTTTKNFYCKVNCPLDFPYEIIETQECVANCSLSDISKKICILNNKNAINIKEKSKEEDNELAKNIQDNIMSGEIDITNIEEGGEDIVIETKGTSFTVTTTENQKNSETKNVSTINLGECETKLKNYYNIPLNKSLYIFKVDVLKEGMKIPKIEYEVYYPLKSTNLEKLNLSVCEDTKVELAIPVSINEADLEKYNSSSDYYTDICSTTTSESGTDITLKDRKNDFIDNNLTLCEEDCEFQGYDTTTKKASCSCKVKVSLPLISEIEIDTNKLKDRFSNIKNIANLNILKCYKSVLSKKGMEKNYGAYFVIASFVAFLICMIIFYVKENKEIKNFIDKILDNKIEIKKVKKISNKKTIKFKKKKRNSKLIDSNDRLNEIVKNTDNPSKKKIKSLAILNTNANVDNGQKTKKRKLKKKRKINKQNLINNQKDVQPIQESTKKEKESEKFDQIMAIDDYEMNNFPYSEALKMDKRTYGQYYLSLIRTEHLLIFSFYNNKDYNSRAIKVSLYILNLVISFTVNALFFDDSTMHQIYEDEGDFNFIYQTPQILYSAIISGILNAIIKILALTEDRILELKQEKVADKDKLVLLAEKIKGIIFYKLLFFYILSFSILGLSWYYISCFCCIYKNTQLHLIKDTLISSGLSLLYPFLVLLIPGIFRISALKAKKQDKEYMYNFSKILLIL